MTLHPADQMRLGVKLSRLCPIIAIPLFLILCIGATVAHANTALSSQARLTVLEELRQSPHFPLEPSLPSANAIARWHKSVISGDFPTYQTIALPIGFAAMLGATSQEELERTFNEIRKTVPSEIKISAPHAMPSGNVLFHGEGCKEGLFKEALMSASFDGKQWRVSGGVWSSDEKKRACRE